MEEVCCGQTEYIVADIHSPPPPPCSNMWVYASSFTSVSANKLHKLYKKAIKEMSHSDHHSSEKTSSKDGPSNSLLHQDVVSKFLLVVCTDVVCGAVCGAVCGVVCGAVCGAVCGVV